MEFTELNQRLIVQEGVVLASAHLSGSLPFTQLLRQFLRGGNQFLVFTKFFL
ncbi:MAG: hypothetical protein ACJA1Q_000752 [Pseudohongiellaceae bacterium]|jgi:hypothetical protein